MGPEPMSYARSEYDPVDQSLIDERIAEWCARRGVMVDPFTPEDFCAACGSHNDANHNDDCPDWLAAEDDAARESAYEVAQSYRIGRWL